MAIFKSKSLAIINQCSEKKQNKFHIFFSFKFIKSVEYLYPYNFECKLKYFDKACEDRS